MQDPDFEQETRRLISLAAERFGGPEADMGELPYDDPCFDQVFGDMREHVRRTLGDDFPDFMVQMLDEAGTMFASVRKDGKEWQVEARLFAMVVNGDPAAVAARASPDNLAAWAEAMLSAGLAPRDARIAFVPFALPLSVLGDMSPSRLRRLTHCLAAGAVPGFPAAAHPDPGAILGWREGQPAEPQSSANPGCITKAVVGVRCTRTRPHKRMLRDWFSRFDASDVAAAACDAWEARMVDRTGDVQVGMPMTWMEVAGLASTDHVVGAFGEEAACLGLPPVAGHGTLHHFEGPGTLSVALALPDGRVLGPVGMPQDCVLDGLGLLSTVLAITGNDYYKHVSETSFSLLVMRGAASRHPEDDDDAAVPRPGAPAPGDGMPALH